MGCRGLNPSESSATAPPLPINNSYYFLKWLIPKGSVYSYA